MHVHIIYDLWWNYTESIAINREITWNLDKWSSAWTIESGSTVLDHGKPLETRPTAPPCHCDAACCDGDDWRLDVVQSPLHRNHNGQRLCSIKKHHDKNSVLKMFQKSCFHFFKMENVQWKLPLLRCTLSLNDSTTLANHAHTPQCIGVHRGKPWNLVFAVDLILVIMVDGREFVAKAHTNCVRIRINGRKLQGLVELFRFAECSSKDWLLAFAFLLRFPRALIQHLLCHWPDASLDAAAVLTR